MRTFDQIIADEARVELVRHMMAGLYEEIEVDPDVLMGTKMPYQTISPSKNGDGTHE